METAGGRQHSVLHAPGVQNQEGYIMKDDEDDYELANFMHLIATVILFLLALVGIAGLAGFLWGML